MQLFYFHSQRIDRLLHSNFWMFETSVWLHTIGRSLIAVFIPILLLVSGFSLDTVILYYFFYFMIDVFLNFLARLFIIKFGARICIIIATLATIVFFVILSQISNSDSLVFLGILALLAAIYDSFYWVSHLFLFMEIEKKEKNTKVGTGFLYAIRKFGTLLGPIVGALFLIFISEDALIFVSILFFVISVIPLFRLKQVNDKPKEVIPLSIKKFNSSDRFVFVNHFIWSMHRVAESTIWPIFIFVVFETIQSVAAISIIASITSIIFSYFSGFFSKRKTHFLILLGASIVLIIWIMRMFFHVPIFYYISVVVVGFVTLFISIPLDRNIFKIGSKNNPLNVSTIRNSASMFAGFIFFGIILLLVNIFQTSFIIASLSVFGLIVILTLFRKKYSLS